jgi:hypothetical protein
MTATEKVLAEELIPAIADVLRAIERLAVALALDAHVEGKLPFQPAAKRGTPPRRRNRRSR